MSLPGRFSAPVARLTASSRLFNWPLMKESSKQSRKSGDWKLETGEAGTIRSKANEIKKKMGVLRERKRVEDVGFCLV